MKILILHTKKLRIRNLPNGNTANVFEQDSNPDLRHSTPSFLVTSSTVPAVNVLSCSDGDHPEDRQTSSVTVSFLKARKSGADTRNLWPGISKSGGSSRQGAPGDEYSLRAVDVYRQKLGPFSSQASF